jgi:hypothetical protein
MFPLWRSMQGFRVYREVEATLLLARQSWAITTLVSKPLGLQVLHGDWRNMAFLILARGL